MPIQYVFMTPGNNTHVIVWDGKGDGLSLLAHLVNMDLKLPADIAASICLALIHRRKLALAELLTNRFGGGMVDTQCIMGYGDDNLLEREL